MNLKPLRPILAALLALPLLAAPAAAPKAAPPKSQPAPLVDRELFFGNPEIAGAQLSPDGTYIAFVKPWKETRNVWVKKTGEPYSTAKLVTADPKRPIPGFFWSRDSKRILFVQDKDGDENYNVYAVDPTAKPAEGKDAPEARNLTDAKGVRAMIYSVPRRDPEHIYVGLNDRDAAWHDLYKVNINSGERTLIRKNTERIAGWVFDLKGQLRLAVRTSDKGDTEILRVDPEGFKVVYSCNVFESCGPVAFHKDGKRIYLETNKGNRDLIQLVLFDPATGKETFVESDPLKRVDLGGVMFSELTEEIQATMYNDERTRIYFKDKALEADYKLLKQKLPNSELSMVSATTDEKVMLIHAGSDINPGSCYLFDRTTKKLSPEYSLWEKLPREAMANMKAIRYPSSDGLSIPAFLTLPKGVPAKNLPLVALPHGGPWARDGWGYDNLAQFLANRGYAVLQPNFRGSTGYGKKFLNAGNKQWGEKMQDDITWGVKHLVKQGIADPKRVGIMGGSYGGYATLAGVTFTPDLYQAAVSIVGPSNLLTLLETIPPYWEAARIIFHERMGNPTNEAGKKQLERQSPLNSASKIKTPLMVIQGANDPRVKKAESEQIVIALRDRGFPVEYICAPDEGHGFARPVNSLAMFSASERFLAKHLGGRFQEGGSAESQTRLKEITVDPKTVVLAPKVDANAASVPKPTADLAPEAYAIAGTLSVQGQSMPLSGSQEIRDENGAWSILQSTKLPMGEGTDLIILEKGTLIPRKRTVKQGPVTIELAFKDGKATGQMSMNGQSNPIDLNLGGELFADGPGAGEVIARLELAEGFSTVVRNLDLQKQKLSLRRIKVAATESVTVPAGTFSCWKVEITSAEGDPGSMTLWLDKATRKAIKTILTLPEMGNATVTVERQP